MPGRVNNVHGDRNLVCSCAGMEAYMAFLRQRKRRHRLLNLMPRRWWVNTAVALHRL